MLFLILLFTLVPAVELYLLIQAGQFLGALDTIGIVILTGILGAWASKSQGRHILGKLQTQVQRGQMPGNILLHGLAVFVGGILLITPGFITDIFGLSLVFPFTRPLWVQFFKRRFQAGVKLGKVKVHTQFGGFDQSGEWQEMSRDVTPDMPPKQIKPADIIDISDYR